MQAPRFSLVAPDEDEGHPAQEEQEPEADDAETAEEEAEDIEETEEMSAEDEAEEPEEEATGGERSIGAIIRRMEAGEATAQDAEIIRELNRNWAQNQNREADLNRLEQEIDRRLAEFERRVESAERGDTETEEDADDLSDLDQEEIANLERVLKARGYTRNEDLENREIARERGEITTAHHREAIEMFGADFGEMGADGRVKVNPEALEKMTPVYDRLTRLQALSLKDTYILGNFEDLMNAQYEKGKREAVQARNNGTRNAVDRARRGTVARRPSGGERAEVEYKGDGDLKGFFRKERARLGYASER